MTEAGFEIKTEEDVLTDLRSDIASEFGALNASQLDTGPLATIVHIIAKLAAAIWLLALSVYNSQGPSTAFGALLDRVLELSGILRQGSAASAGFVVALGTNGTLLSAGRRIKNAVTLTYWTTTEDATIATLSAWAGSTEYAKYSLATNDTGKVYVCTAAGTSDSSGGPTGTGTAITDGTATWRYVGTGDSGVVVGVESELEGQIIGAAGDLSSIETPIAGWDSVVNPLDADVGRETETDAALRIRRKALLRSTGNAATDAIVGDMLDVDGVTRAICFRNDKDFTDANGLPPHSVEVLVLGGTDEDVAAGLLATAAAGIRTHGTTSVDVTDAEGELVTVKFSRPTSVDIYVSTTVQIDAATFPVDGDTQIKQAIVDFCEGLEVGGYQFAYGMLDLGDDVIRDDLRVPIKQVSGVTSIAALTLGTAPSPAGTADIVITGRQVAVMDTSRIVVTHA